MEEIIIDLHVKKAIHTADGVEILDVEIKIPRYGFITFFGKSGAGKSTLLRIMAGLTHPDEGYIKVDQQTWFDSKAKINVRPQDRNIGFVFQDYALFPNMTVIEHLMYAQPEKDLAHVEELLSIFHLGGLSHRKPSKLSGGQQQRLAVARALARKPKILLLDEPLSALDSETRSILQNEIIQAHMNFKATTLLVSHDIKEVCTLSNYIYIIENGKIIKQGKPNSLFSGIKINTKFQLTGKVLQIEDNILTVSVNNAITKMVVTEDELKYLAVGDTILITTLAVNPLIKKILPSEII